MTSTSRDTETFKAPLARRNPLFSFLTGLSALAVLLQGVWAGVFLQHDGEREASASWIDVHARGADISIALTFAALIVAIAKLRSRADLMLGTVALLVLLVAESYLGGLIRDNGKYSLTVIHVPFAMALMALAVWLPLRSWRATGRS